jgi:hypothetical protein
MALQRYDQDVIVASSQSGFVDLIDWLGFLCAREYLIELLKNTHGLGISVAKVRADQIVPHVRIAVAYIRQSLDGPDDLSFLPAYYAILNLMKVYVLLGPRHADLKNNRLHGVTYFVGGKDSHTILTEEIRLLRKGVLPLFYETVTGNPLPGGSLKLKIRDFLKYVAGVWFEYSLATKDPVPFCVLGFGTGIHQGELRHQAVIPSQRPDIQVRGNVLCLRNFRRDATNPFLYVGPRVIKQQNLEIELRSLMHRCLLYRIEPMATYAALGNYKSVEFPQELPSALLFFYMSSIVRYKPEFFNRLKDSKFWPVVSSARLHSFLDFLLTFWSFAHKRNYYINPPHRTM